MTRNVFAHAASGLAAAVATIIAQAASPPSLDIDSPRPGDPPLAPLTLAARVSPDDLPVESVMFYVDGELACRVTARPFSCTWNVPSVGGPRTVRVVAMLAGGRTLTKSVRTDASVGALRASTDAVLVPAHVTDDDFTFVPGLSVANFRLLEDGVPQPIASVLSEQAPLHLFLALDISGSMAKASGELRAAASRFLLGMRPEDRLTVGAFNDALLLMTPPAVDASTAKHALDRLGPSTGGTALFDMIIEAVRVLERQPSPRALVLFTDGDDDASHASLASARAVLQESNVPLYLIARGAAADESGLHDRWLALAHETGGGAWFASRLTRLDDYFGDVVEDLRNEYVLAYSPIRALSAGEFRHISVEATGSNRKRLKVRAREGYLAVARNPS